MDLPHPTQLSPGFNDSCSLEWYALWQLVVLGGTPVSQEVPIPKLVVTHIAILTSRTPVSMRHPELPINPRAT